MNGQSNIWCKQVSEVMACDQNLWKNASRDSPLENIVPAQYMKSEFWKIKLKLKFGNIKKTIQFIMISYSDCFKINENTN